MRYAAAISAYSKAKVAVTVSIFAAASEDEASGRAVRIARETWPPDEGWSAHQGSVLLIQDGETYVEQTKLDSVVCADKEEV